ncbi:hypothetical protein BC830DRAFT_1087924 [Chytriomyces sp. MP71]|nr:hypothetical protein BC830DRAFT_1087924 [Chytriomyces sp. MP71]
MESSVAVPRRTTSISRSRTRRAGNGDGDGVDREAIARGDGRGPGEDGLLMGTDTVDFSIPGDGLDAQQALFDEYLSLSPITFPNGNGAVAGGEGAALTLSMASPPQTTTTGFSAPTTPEKYDEDSFLDFYAETPVDSGGPFVLSSPQMPFPNSSHPPVPTTPAPPPPPQQQPQQHHPQTQPFNMPLPFQLPYNNSGQSLRRTNTASSISSLALARSRTVLGENQASVIIPTRQSSRGPGGLAQRFNALTSSASTGQLVPTRGIAVSEKGRSQTPTPGTYKPILEGAAASASPSVSLSSTHHVQIEQLLESGLRALALLNISDALSLWKQAVGGSQEGSLTTVRALSNLCVGYRRHGNFAKSRDASRDAWRILERGIWVEVLDSLPGGHAIGGGAPSGGKSLSSNSTTISSLTSGSSASKESAIGSGTGVNTDAVVNLLVGVGLIGFDEGFALGTDDMPGGGSLNGRKGTLGGKSIGRKASYTPSHASTFHASSASSQPPLPSHQTPPPFHMPSPLPSLQEDDRDLDEALLSDPLIKSMRAVIKVVKRWLERRRFEYLASTNIGKTHQPPTLFNNHRMPSKMTRMGSLDSFSTVASSESAPSASPFPQIPVDPVLLVTVLDLCTNTGNLYYTMQSYQVATFFHESCLDLAQDILTTIPLPAKEPPASPTSSIKLSYLHSNTLMAKSRSMSHLSLCLGACGDVHRAVRFGQMSFASIASVAGPQPADRAGVHAKQWRFTRAAIAGNLGRAQFAVGRYVEGMRGCVAAVKAFSREDKYGTVEGGSCAGEQTAAADRVPTVSAADRAGLLRALVNVAACWVEAGRLGCMVNVWVGDAKTSGLRRAGTGEDVEPDFAFYDQHFAIPRPNMTSPSVSIPQRKHSALRKESMGTDIDLGILREIKVAFARKNSPLWFADVLTGIRLLERVISEAGKYKYLECVGIARFNIGLLAFCLSVVPLLYQLYS